MVREIDRTPIDWREGLLGGMLHDALLSDFRLSRDGSRLRMRFIDPENGTRDGTAPDVEYALTFKRVPHFSVTMSSSPATNYPCDPREGDPLASAPREETMQFSFAREIEPKSTGARLLPWHKSYHAVEIAALNRWDLTVVFGELVFERVRVLPTERE